MLRREIRLFVFIATFVLLLILFYQLNVTTSSHRQVDLATKEFSDYAQGRNLKSYWKEKATSRYTSESLPRSVIENVGQFLFFVGYARSGHSIIASMLDAHPNVVISHEYALFTKWESEPEKHKNKTWLFNTLYDNSRLSTYHQGLRTKQALKKGYTLAIPGSWQGRYDTSTGISVIGDKSGGMTAQVFRKNRKHFLSLYQELQNTVQVPIHAIHVVRNPYDNIATMLLYNEHQKFKVNETHKYEDEEGLESQIISYFHQVSSVVEMINEVGLKVTEIHNKEFIANPKATLRRLCLALHIDCSEGYLHLCSSKAFTSESRSRSLVKWTPSLIDKVYQNIQKYKHLQRYSFYS